MANVPADVIKRSEQDRLAFIQLFKNSPEGPRVLQLILRLLHFYEPAQDDIDRALQNAAKGILHHLGSWGSDEEAEADIVRKLLRDV